MTRSEARVLESVHHNRLCEDFLFKKLLERRNLSCQSTSVGKESNIETQEELKEVMNMILMIGQLTLVYLSQGVVRCTSERQRPHQLAILPFRDKRSGLRLLDNPCLSVAIVSRSSERRMLTFTDLGKDDQTPLVVKTLHTGTSWQSRHKRQCKLLFAKNHHAEPNRTRGCGTSGFLSL